GHDEMITVVEANPQNVHREAPCEFAMGVGPSEEGVKTATGEGEGAGTLADDELGELVVRRRRQEVGRPLHGLSPRLALGDRHRSSSVSEASATTSRNTASAASRAVARPPSSGAISPSWRSRSTSCFMVRTKSPPVRSS